MTPKVQTTKAKPRKWDNINVKSFCTAKETINRMKRQPTEWKEIIANNILGKDPISKILFKKLI